jgi:hypothetical protein
VLTAAQNGLLTFQALFRLSLDLPSYKYKKKKTFRKKLFLDIMNSPTNEKEGIVNPYSANVDNMVSS